MGEARKAGNVRKITLSDEANFYADFLVKDEDLRYFSVLVERLIMQAVKKRKMSDRPVYCVDRPLYCGERRGGDDNE